MPAAPVHRMCGLSVEIPVASNGLSGPILLSYYHFPNLISSSATVTIHSYDLTTLAAVFVQPQRVVAAAVQGLRHVRTCHSVVVNEG